MEIVEEHLRDLLLRGLQADAAAYERFLKELGAHLRACGAACRSTLGKWKIWCRRPCWPYTTSAIPTAPICR